MKLSRLHQKLSRIIVLVLITLLLLQGLSTTVFAGPPAGTWVTGIQIQNVDTVNTATVTIYFYWAAGVSHTGPDLAYQFTDTIAPSKAKTYYVPNITGVPVNFVGSVVVSSDFEIAAIVNTAKDVSGQNNATAKRIGAALGISAPSTTVYAPYLRKNYYNRNSYIAVQNTADVTTTVYVRYTAGNGTPIDAATETATLPPFATKIFYQNDNGNLPSGFFGSAVITGTNALATVINNANAGTTRSDAGFESYNGFASTAGATTVYLPKLTVNYANNYSGLRYQSGFQIQNAGTVAATMQITYQFGGTSFTKTSPLIQPGASWSVYLANASASGITAGFSGAGSATVTSAQPMVAVVIETHDGYGYSVVSTGVAAGSGTSTILFPKFDTRYSTNNAYNGGIQVQNLGTVATAFRATFSMAGRADVVVTSPVIQPGQSYAWYGPNVSPTLGTGFGGSVVVVSLADQPIAGVYTSRNDTLVGDTYTAYNGIQK